MGKKRIIKAHTDKAGSSVGVENLSIQNNLTVTGATQSGSFTTNGTDTFDYEEATINLVNSGAFNMNGTLKLVRVGNVVTITSSAAITHNSLSDGNSATGVIPASFRSTVDTANMYRIQNTSRLCQFTVRTSGAFSLTYWNTSYGLTTGYTDSYTSVNITYNIV